jgi:phage FluMu protein Com
LKCDHTEPWKKSVVRIKTAGRKYIFGRCPQCKRIHIRVIEQKPQNPTVKEP